MSLTGKQAKEFYVDRWVRNLGYLSKLKTSMGLKITSNTEYESITTGVVNFEKKLIKYGDNPIKEIDLKRLNDLQDRVSRFISAQSGIKFVNREDQTKKFSGESLDKSSKRIKFAFIEAPARYGKSYLLNKIKAQQGKEWHTIKYAFREHPDTINDVEGFLKKLLIKIMQENDNKGLRKTFSKKELNNEIYRQTESEGAEVLADQVVGELINFEKLYFFIDDAEIVGPDVRNCICSQILPKLRSKVDATPKMNVICIVAGRHVTSTWLNHDSRHDNKLEDEFIHRDEWEPEFLYPLRTKHILDALDRLLEKCNLPAEKYKREEFAHIVNMATSGHPESVVSTLLYIGAQTKFAYGKGYWEEHRDKIFKKFVQPMCEVVLHEDNDLAENFRSICIFRKYNEKIANLVNKEYGEMVLSVLEMQGLVYRESDHHFYKDDRLRRILTFEKWVYFSKQARELNKLAKRYFEDILRNPTAYDIEDMNYYRSVITEYIYHCIMELVHDDKKSKNKIGKFKNILLGSLSIYRENWQIKHDVLEKGFQKSPRLLRDKKQEQDNWDREKKKLRMLLQEDEEIVSQSIHIYKNEKSYHQMLYKVFD